MCATGGTSCKVNSNHKGAYLELESIATRIVKEI